MILRTKLKIGDLVRIDCEDAEMGPIGLIIHRRRNIAGNILVMWFPVDIYHTCHHREDVLIKINE